MKKTMEIKKNEFLRQFEASVDYELITIEFAEQERKMFLTKMVISDHLREDGYVDVMVRSVLNLLKDQGVKVVPTCIEVKSFIRKNKFLYQDLLPVGIAL